MTAKYIHIGFEERKLIWRLRKAGLGVREISRELLRAPSTISRELTRNDYSRESHPLPCHYKAVRRRRESYRKPRLKSKELQELVITKLQAGHSPEQIAGRLQLEEIEPRVCTEAIYQFIYDKRPDLTRALCRKYAKRRPFRHSRKTKRLAPIPQRISIAERPPHIELRDEIGHWESDLAISKMSPPALQILVERKTRFVIISKTQNKSGPEVAQAMINALKRYPKSFLRTITFDNGAENAGHRAVNCALKTKSYFCDPYRSWQKGTVENTVGLVRRIFPKGYDFKQLSQKDLKKVQNALNNRPRKCLGFKTPAETMAYERVAIHS